MLTKRICKTEPQQEGATDTPTKKRSRKNKHPMFPETKKRHDNMIHAYFLLDTLYIWIAPHHSLSAFTYVDFLNLFYVRPF
jgi:hypothetical protein